MLGVLAFVFLLISFSGISALRSATIDCGDGIMCYYADSGIILNDYVKITFCDFQLSLDGKCTDAEEVLELYVPQDSCSGENMIWSRKDRTIRCDCTEDSRRDSNGICRTETFTFLGFINNLSWQHLIISINNSPAFYNCGLFVALAVGLPIGLYYFHKKISRNFSKSLQNDGVIQTSQ